MGIAQCPSVSHRAISLLMTQPWRGNVRELENVLERGVALDRDGIIGMDDLPFAESQRSEDRIIERARKDSLTLSELEREYILEVLTECGGSRKKTAERLGITTATLWRKLKLYERERNTQAISEPGG
jgi:two-component system response regulator PilR (NtrC family)/two-component system response regulator AtoC